MNKEKTTLTKDEKNILCYLSLLGTPKIYRDKLWLLCSGAKSEIKEHKNYYKKLLELSKNIYCPQENQIKKDIPRTKPEKINEDPSLKEKMKNVLICYSIRNSSIGYCQGFNFIIFRLFEILKYEVIFIFILIIGRSILGFL